MEMVVKIRTTHQQEQRMLADTLMAISRLDHKRQPADVPASRIVDATGGAGAVTGTRRGWTLSPESRKRMALAQQKRRKAERASAGRIERSA